MKINRRTLLSGFLASAGTLGASILIPNQAEARRRWVPSCQCNRTESLRSSLVINKGFDYENFPYHDIDGHAVKIFPFLSASENQNSWTDHVRTIGRGSTPTLKMSGVEWYYTLNDRNSGSEGYSYLILGVYDNTTNSARWFAAWDAPGTWWTIGSARTNIPNGTGQSQRIPITNLAIVLNYRNPDNTGGWTGHDIIYSVNRGV